MPVLPRLVPLLIGLFTINALISGNFAIRAQRIRNSIPAMISVVFYTLHLVGLLWTQNIPSGLFDTQVKLSIILFPFILFGEPSFSSRDIRKICLAFVSGCFASSMILFSVSAFDFFESGQNHFTYTALSRFIHPSYISMYYLLAIYILWQEFIHKKKLNILVSTIAMFLIVSVILFSSKINVFILFTGLLMYGVSIIRNSSNYMKTGAVIFLFLITLYLVIDKNKSLKDRTRESLKSFSSDFRIRKNETSSTTARMLVWDAGLALLKDNYLYGLGTGDVKDELTQQYLRMGYTGIAEKKLNAHNQFMQSALAIGITGLFILLAFFFYALKQGKKEKHTILIAFCVITIINCLVESILETQAGVVFFAFFSALLLKKESIFSETTEDKKEKINVSYNYSTVNSPA